MHIWFAWIVVVRVMKVVGTIWIRAIVLRSEFFEFLYHLFR